MIGLSKLPSFFVNLRSEVLCKSCGGGVSSLEEMVQHWRKEKGGVDSGRPKIPSDKNGEMVKHWREERSEGKLVSQGQGRVPHAEVVFVNNKQEVEVGVARKEDVKVMNNKEVVMMNSKEVEVICSKGDVNVMNNREEAIKNNKEEVGHTEAVGDKFGPKNRKMAKLHRCSECDYSSEAKVNFLTHLSKTHRIETPNRSLMCDFCGYRTYVPAHLKNHTEAKHNGRIFNCNQCDFKTSYQMSLMHHKNIHDKDNWLQCDLCTYRCATSGNLKTHIDGKHNDTPSYPCPDCHSIFKTSSARSIHKVRIITTLIITTSSLPSSSSSSSSS